MLDTLYPDLMRGPSRPPSLLVDEARAWVEGLPPMWRSRRDLGAPETLAIVGALAMSATLGRPCGWDGEALHGRIDLLGALADTEARYYAASGALVLLHGANREILQHRASKLWAGQVTAGTIWRRSHGLVAEWRDERESVNRAAGPDADSRIPRWSLPLDRMADQPISATGYDNRIVGDPITLGFSPAIQGIRLVGGRPLVELLGLIGAAYLELRRMWRGGSNRLRLPRLGGIVLRDVLDLDRLLLTQREWLSCEIAMIGSRRYLCDAS